MKKILVIDDDRAVRRSFALALEDSGYGLEVAENGTDGIRSFDQNRHDLVFLDLKMPGISGIETLRSLRRIDPEKPIYIVTAFFGEYFQEIKEALNEGISFEILQKPVEDEQILHLARAILDQTAFTEKG